MISLLWFTRDLRVHDNPTLIAASASVAHVVPVFCFDERLLRGRHSSGVRTQFLLESLGDLDASLRKRGSGLVVRRGPPERELVELAEALGAERFHFSADVGPFARRRERRVREALRSAGVEVHAHSGLFAVDDLLEEVRTTAGTPYTVFTPFFSAWRAAPRREPDRPPRALPPLPAGVERGRLPTLAELGLRQELRQASARRRARGEGSA